MESEPHSQERSPDTLLKISTQARLLYDQAKHDLTNGTPLDNDYLLKKMVSLSGFIDKFLKSENLIIPDEFVETATPAPKLL